MCGRCELDIDDDELVRRFNLRASNIEIQRRYNVTPSQTLPIITEAEPAQLLAPYPATAMQASAISRLVNSPANYTPAINDPVAV